MIFRALFFCISTLREFLRVFALSREKKFFKGKGYFRNCLLVAACSLFLSFSCYGQVDPVQGTAGLIPPYALRLSDYTTSSSERLALNILLADLTKADLHVRFRISITGQNVKLETKPEYIGSMITMQGGVPLRLTNVELAEYFDPNHLNFSGISKADFLKTGILPEGFYQFCFEVIEFNRGVQISNSICAPAWLILNDPPLINLPLNTSKLKPLFPQNVMLQWTPRHTGSPNAAFTTEYEVKVVEVWPANRNPNDAILSQPAIYEATTNSTSLIYGPDATQLEPGRTYAFRVQAKAMTGAETLDLFKNNGYSETVSFIYGDACDPPVNIVAQAETPSRISLQWDASPSQTGYTLHYRVKGQSDANWYSSTSLIPSTEISGLQPNTTYEYEVMSTCGSFESTFGDIATITTEDISQKGYSCGVTSPDFNLDPSQLLPILKVNDVVNTGDFEVTITKVSGSNGMFSGEGAVVVPFLNQIRARVNFQNITVNNDKRMVNGFMNVTGAGIEVVPSGVMDMMDQLSQGLDVTQKVLDSLAKAFPPKPDPTTFVATEEIKVTEGIAKVFKDPISGDVIVVDNKGGTQKIPAGKDVVVTDSNGKGTLVNSQGGVTNTTAAQAVACTKRELNLNLTFAKASNTVNGFDEQKYEDLKKYYEQLGDKYVSWKSVPTSAGDAVKATSSGKDAKLDAIKIDQDGTPIGSTIADNAIQFTAYSVAAGTKSSVVARVPPPDTTKKEQILGKLNIVGYEPKPMKLIVVPVNNPKVTLTANAIKAQLDTVYAQAVITWDVELKQSIQVSGIANPFDDGGSGLLSNYTGDMKTVINAFGDLADETYYLFLIDQSASGNKLGYMPRGKQAGFIFIGPHGNNVKDIIHTMAHELGHGPFTLQHTFLQYPSITEKSTDNLLDYNNGSRLWKYQWDQIHDPVTVLGLFESDAAGSYETDGHYSTVYLVCLLLGIDPSLAKSLAEAAEAPDTYVHGDYQFEINDTWSDAEEQVKTHSLTYGYHGTEELITALAVLNTPTENTTEIGRLLHRYGDTYAHTRLDNLTPSQWDAVDQYESISWFIDKWMQFINQGIKENGLTFLKDENIQRKYLSNMTLVEFINKNYLLTSSQNFTMYGKVSKLWGMTFEHMNPDGPLPDFIYVRPKWYLRYVQNLAKLLSVKYAKPMDNFDITIFEKMVNYGVSKQCSLKGIIDYEISKRLKKKYFFIPVYYSRKAVASLDAVFNTDYIALADQVKKNTLDYLLQSYNITSDHITVEEIERPWYNPIFNSKGISTLYSYKLTVK